MTAWSCGPGVCSGFAVQRLERWSRKTGSVPVVKCYCRSNDVVTTVEAEQQARPSFIFPDKYFKDLEGLIGKELEGRMYSDSRERRVKFCLDLGEHAGFQTDEGRNLESPWYDDRVMRE